MRFRSLATLALLLMTVLVLTGYTQVRPPFPVLRYNPPPNFFKIWGYGSSEVCISTQDNATIQIYQFR